MSKNGIKNELKRILGKEVMSQDTLATKIMEKKMPLKDSYKILRTMIDCNEVPYKKDISGKYIFLTSF